MPLKISVLLDGQLDPSEVRPVLDAIASDPALRDRYTVYGLVGDTLRGNSTLETGSPYAFCLRGARIEPGYDPLAD